MTLGNAYIIVSIPKWVIGFGYTKFEPRITIAVGEKPCTKFIDRDNWSDEM